MGLKKQLIASTGAGGMARMTNSILALSVNLSRDRQRRCQSPLIMQRSRWRGRDLGSRQLDKALLISAVLASIGLLLGNGGNNIHFVNLKPHMI